MIAVTHPDEMVATWRGRAWRVDLRTVNELALDTQALQGLTVADIARRAGVGRSTLWRFLNGHPVREAHARAIVLRGVGGSWQDVVIPEAVARA